ncbi:hypothetical protein GQ54DRAFT_260169 [Martensiomyces pterosporus]|nr:hypothetical protein GQ54DRAFT_260169 [Martensiomyces pterosporus]
MSTITTLQTPESKADAVFQLLENGSKQGYIGENISQLEHALQAALRATEAGADEETILAALLHDIGQFCPAKELQRMLDGSTNVGVMGHEKLGAEYLRKIGFSEKVCELVESHVVGKRYLTSVDPAYYEGLSSASKLSLKFQGGPFSLDDARRFEKDPLFEQKVQLRKWDDASKIVDFKTPDLQSYKPMAIRHLEAATHH